jgi:hypothetical protein
MEVDGVNFSQIIHIKLSRLEKSLDVNIGISFFENILNRTMKTELSVDDYITDNILNHWRDACILAGKHMS